MDAEGHQTRGRRRTERFFDLLRVAFSKAGEPAFSTSNFSPPPTSKIGLSFPS
jgi:hypothetical protein